MRRVAESLRRRTVSVVLGAALVGAGCSSGADPQVDATPQDAGAVSSSAAAPSSPSAVGGGEDADREVAAAVTTAFATYRAGVVTGDSGAVMDTVTEASIADQARVVEIARSADEATMRALPAADQLTALTYRLRPQLLEAEDPYAALVDAGLAGQDRTLGELGDVTAVSEDLALGQVLTRSTLQPTPVRWRFVREAGTWRFDLVDAQKLLSEAIANTARRAGQDVDDLVAETLVDLSRETPETVQALYSTPPPS